MHHHVFTLKLFHVTLQLLLILNKISILFHFFLILVLFLFKIGAQKTVKTKKMVTTLQLGKNW